MTTADGDASVGLRPVRGPGPSLRQLVEHWLYEADPPPLAVRTSGSTGEPKDVLLSARALRASATATSGRLGGEGQWLLALPVEHVAGLQVLVRSVLAGQPLVALDDHLDLMTATAALSGPRRYLSLVPTQLHRWLAQPLQVEALRRYDAVLVGGAATSADLLTEARRQGVAVVTTYGMTETCGGCVYDGVGLDGVAVALDAQGRVRLAGPMLFDGYSGRPDLTAEALQDGWLRTQDLGRIDDDGHLVVMGRVDDIVVSGGVNVALPAVEVCVAAMPAVEQAAIVGVPDDRWGARIVAAVVLGKGGATVELSEVRACVAERHSRSWAPRQLLVVSALPLLESGKLDRLKVVRWAVDSFDERRG